MLAGATRGVFTLLQATAISDRWGSTHGGRIATALSPWAGAVLATALGGYPLVFALLAVIAAVAAVLAAGSIPRTPNAA
ncbi:hypothetical protein [Pseudonocardia abyssalis]|uniref:MFS transporter n=1 Tax=Pseudonocardia abyssalis TaxID=2792008 RepID=A0ABS6UYS1_9PSEU|nr:hypothetical protein [Pseudonocardia abyssalis]MBW0118287.1 hypothetical protein [Pseudonocardia abyssalis]MBW0137404.1 hypothetical protein [Pseudonocardia abyssalis]